MSDYVFAFHFLCWNQGPFLSQYHTFWERLGQLWCLESRAQGHPVIRNHGETNCYRQLASCFGRVAPVGDIHVSITRNVADPESCWNHWCEAIAKPRAIANWPIVLAEWQPLETSCRKHSLICCVSTWWIFNAIEKLETKDGKPLQSHVVHAPGQCLDWVTNIRCSHSETYVACWDNNDSTLIHSVYNPWKPQATTHELSFQDNLPIKHHDWKMWRYVPKGVSCKSVGCQDFCGSSCKVRIKMAGLSCAVRLCGRSSGALCASYIASFCVRCVLMSPKIHSTLNLRLHFMRVCVESASTPGILR